ncbi:hypothetical protein ACS0TY_027657 [Phlomoides rotata]
MIIDSLPQLEVLKLRGAPYEVQTWSCVEEGFRRLKFLSIAHTALESWTLHGASHFPVLEKLLLFNLPFLEEKYQHFNLFAWKTAASLR